MCDGVDNELCDGVENELSAPQGETVEIMRLLPTFHPMTVFCTQVKGEDKVA